MTRFSRTLLFTLAGGAALATLPLNAAPLPADPSSIWTIQDENSSISSAKVTDRFYTNGLRLGWASPTDAVPAAIAGIGRALWGDGQQRISIDLSQQIYTPFDTAAKLPPANDRPYAGVLMATLGLQSDTATSRSTFSLGLGVVGPWALGEEVQNGFHDLIGQKHNNGWGTQLPNEPALQITSSRVWRLKTGAVGSLETEALPELTAGVGTVRVYALTGATFRIGQGLDADFGAARVRPGLSSGDAFQHRDFGWYVFVGADGQGVARDITLDGPMWDNGRSVKRKSFIGEGQAGLALLLYGARLSYTHVIQSQQFEHQHGGLHQFGSLALSVRF